MKRELTDAEVFGAPDPDTDFLVRTVWGEARGEPSQGRKAVAAVVRNRAKLANRPIRDVVLAKGQFEPWGDPRRRREMEALDPSSPEYQAILADVQAGDDPTGGATHFYAPRAQAALGRRPPAWAQGEGQQIGGHRFFRVGYQFDDAGQAPRELSDAEVFGGAAAGPPEAPQAAPATQTPRKPPPPLPRAPMVAQRAPGPTIAQDVASGFAQPFQTLGHGVMQDIRGLRERAKAGPPTSLAEAGRQGLDDLMQGPRLVGDVLGMAAAPIMAAVRPTARAIGRVAPTPYEAPKLTFENGRIGLTKPRALAGEEAQAATEGLLTTALSGARPANVAPKVAKAKPQNLEQLKAAKDAAYKAVDQSGFTFPQKDLKALAKQVVQAVDDAGGSELNEQAAKIASRIKSLADKGSLTLSQLDKLRAQVGEKVIAKGEPTLGYEIRDMVDGLIDAANVPEMRQARAANTRYMKVKEVTDRLESADLAQSTSGNGGNQNAPRQKLRPLIDPKSNQRMKNLTPDEAKALKRAVRGTPTQNAMRMLGALDPTSGKLSTMLHTGAALGTSGLSAVAMPVGMMGRAMEAQIGARNVQKLLDLMSIGGAKPAPRGYAPAPVSRLLSPAGLTGVGVTTAPLVRIPAPKVRDKTRR